MKIHFAKAMREFTKETGIAARTLAKWAGRRPVAAQRWTAGDATPELPAFRKMLGLVPAEWRARLQEAWDRDNTPEHVWDELNAMRKSRGMSPLASAAEACSRAMPDDDHRRAIREVLAIVTAKPDLARGLLATATGFGQVIKPGENGEPREARG